MYLDSAIIVKLIVREAGSDWFSRNLARHSFETSARASSPKSERGTSPHLNE